MSMNTAAAIAAHAAAVETFRAAQERTADLRKIAGHLAFEPLTDISRARYLAAVAAAEQALVDQNAAAREVARLYALKTTALDAQAA